MSEYNDNNEDTREVEAMRKMFVGGLNRDTSDEDFFDHFAQFGNMVDKVVIKDPNTKTSRGFGFITYDASSAVENVFQNRPHDLDGKTLDVKRAMPREFNTNTAHAKVTKLFIGGVGLDLTPSDLQEYIEGRHDTTIGTVSNIEFITDKETGKNKGFGFLECSSNDFADRLTISENKFFINDKQMSLKKAEVKGEGNQGGGRGGFRGRGRGTRGAPRGGGGRGGFNRNGFQGGNNYNNQGGGYQQQSGGYGGYGGGYQQQYNQTQGYNQSGGYDQNQSYNNQYNPNQGYNQGTGYNQSNNQGYAGNQNYGGNQAGYGGGNQQNGNNRYTPY